MTKGFSRLLGSGALTVSALAALPASATPLLFSYTPTTDTRVAFTFNVDSQPKPTEYSVSDFFLARITNATGQYAHFGTIGLANTLSGGGLENYYGPQLYTGTESAPTISVGTFTLYYDNNVAQAGVLTISAVPEPASWAMMILGVGMVGGFMRRRIRASEVKFDAKIKRIKAGKVAA